MSLCAIALLGLLASLLVTAIVTDLASRTIGNGLNAAVALLALPWWAVRGLGPAEIGVQVALAAVVLLVFAACFAVGMMGGGDVKLLAALALWFPLPVLMTIRMWMALGGGLLTGVMLVRHRLRRTTGAVEVPYGVAICGATLLMMANHILTASVA